MKKSTLALICVSFVISITQTTAFASSRKENTFVIRNNANQNSNKAIFQNDVEEFTDGLFYIHTDKTKEQIIEETGSFDVFEVYTDGINEYVETNELLISGVRDVYAVFKHINMTDVILGIDSICFPKGFTIYKVKCGVSEIDFLCSKIQDSKLCNAVSINFIYQYKTPTSETSDVLNVMSNGNPDSNPYFDQQWSLYNSSNTLLDINAKEAWNLSKGEGVTIALINNGVQLDHPDLKNNILPSYDVTPAPGIKDGSPKDGDSDGTHCAGIIVGEDNNIGIIGVAPKAKIISIKAANSKYSDSDVSYSSDATVIQGIQKAIDCNVDIIYISTSRLYAEPIFDELFEYAYKYGRYGKGSIIVGTTGVIYDEYPNIKYPGNSPKDIIAVGTINKSGNRHERSAYGNAMDVVAPGDNILTTTLNSAYEFAQSSTFAASFVSGVAALMLSFNPDLTYREVQRIINSTATKLPGYIFTNSADHPDGTWNEEVGYGLVNAFEAVKGTMSINGADVLCDEEVYTVEGMPEGADVYWSFGESGIFYVFPPLEIIDGQGTAQATFKRKGEYQLYIDENGVSHPVLIPYVGTQTIKATVTLNGNSCVLEKEVTMPDPDDQHDMTIKDENVTGQFSRIYWGGDTIPLALSYPVWGASDGDIVWTCVFEPDPDKTPESLRRTITLYGNRIEIPTPVAFSGFVHVTVTKSGECNIGEYVVTVMANIMYIDFTNPASGSVDISVKETAAGTQEGVAAMSADAEVYAEPYMGEYRLELWHEVYGMVREMYVEAGNPTVTMDLGGLPPGWYYVRMIADGEMKAVGKLMVR